MKHFKKLLLFITVLTIFSCNHEIIETNNNEKSRNTEESINSEGRILDNFNEPIFGVLVKKNTEIIAISREDGSYYLQEQLNDGDVLTFEDENYVTVSKVINEFSFFTISMKKRSEPEQINSRESNTIDFDFNGEIIIPENAFSYNNEPYDGLVNIQITYIDVTNPSEIKSSPGAFIAEEEENLYPLTSFGMIEIVATIPGENIRLNLLEGRSIKVSFPVLNEETPNTVNLYNFNQLTGYWSQTGILNRLGSTLQGEVTSINSAWNADNPCSDTLVCARVRIVWPSGCGCGYLGSSAGVRGVTYSGYDISMINSSGYAQFMVCPNSVITLSTSISCLSCPSIIRSKTIDLSTISTPSTGCIPLGTWVL